jgi:Flp pilus assembly protein TadD
LIRWTSTRDRPSIAGWTFALLTALAVVSPRVLPAASHAHLSAVEVRKALEERGVEDAVVPFELTPEIRDWVRDRVSRGASRKARLQILIEELLGSGGLGIDYRRSYTGTAAEVFEQRSANCLSFTHLFLGLAREVGVPVFFLEVKDLQDYTKEGDLIVHSDHIAIGHGPAHEMTLIDFAVEEGTKYHKIRPISDLAATALFYSNRGTEHLRRGEVDQALLWAKDAIAIEPKLSSLWINYGVALRRAGSFERAEWAYRHALELDPSQFAAYQNLAALLRLNGRAKEAFDLLAVTDRSANRNPFSYLALGDLSLRHGRVQEAERFYRKAARLTRDEAEPLAALGLFEVDHGDHRSARRLYQRASRLDPAEPRVAQLERALDRARP